MNQAKEPNTPQQFDRLTWPWRAWLAGATLVLLVTIVYWPTLDNGFTGDVDQADVTDNLAIRSLEGLSNIWFTLNAVQQYYPLTYSTFWVEYHLWGSDPVGYHVVNFLLHALSAILVWRLLLRLGVPGAWLAAAIFAVHPVGVESIAPVTERKNVLSCVLALGSLLAYLRFSPPENSGSTDVLVPMARGHWLVYALAFVLYVAALLAKTVTASVPAVLLVIYWWKRGRVTWRDATLTAPFFAVGLALCGITVWVEKQYFNAPDWDFSLVERMLIAGRALWFYAGKLCWPHPLILFYPRWVVNSQQWWQYLFPAAALAVLVGLWLARTRIGRGPLAAVLIFAGVLVPALGFFNLYYPSFVADHFQYHASIALIALAAAAAVTLAGRLPTQARWFTAVAIAGLLLPLAVLAQQKTHAYKDEIALLEDTVAGDPQSWLAHYNLGLCFQNRGKYDEALSHFRQAIEARGQQARDNPRISLFQHNVAGFYADVGLLQREMRRPADAEGSFCTAIEIREQLVRDYPTVSEYQEGLAWCYLNLAYAQHKAGRPADAEVSHRKAIEIHEKLARDNPAISKFKNRVAASYTHVGLFERDRGLTAEAQSAFHKAIEIREKLVRDHPTVAEYQADLAANYEDLAISQQSGGLPADAVASRRKAIEVRQELAQVDGLLTVAKRLGAGEIRQKLVQDNLTVNKYQDEFAASYVDLGLLQCDMGRAVEAESSFHRAITIRERLVRDHPTARDYQNSLAWCHVHLAVAQQKTGRTAEAEASHRKVIEIREKLARDNSTVSQYQNNVAASYVDLGLFLCDVGRPAEAASAFLRAIEIREKLVHDHPTASDYQDGLGWCYVNLGIAQQKNGRPAEAEHSFCKAIEVRAQLVQDDPANAVFQSNLAAGLSLCGDALALSGKWSESADRYAQAVGAGNYSWQTLGFLALVQLAAGNESAYRATCANLVRRYGDHAAPDAVFAMALTLVVGDKALDDMNQALLLAKRAAEADPSNPLAAIVVGAAEYRAGRGEQAIQALTQALSQLDPAVSAAKPDQFLVSRLVGEMILALAYHAHSDHEALEKQLETLRALIDNTKTPATLQSNGGLPPWAARFAVEMAKRELAKLSVPADQSK